jgi:hypothetical protein
MPLAASVADVLRIHLGARKVDYKAVRSVRGFPKKVRFRPEECFANGNIYYLTHVLSSTQLPAWLIKASKDFKKQTNIHIFIVAQSIRDYRLDNTDAINRLEEFKGYEIAAEVTDECVKHGFGLIAQLEEEYALILKGKGLRTRKPSATNLEYGHIPKWILKAVSNLPSVSEYTNKCLLKFIELYNRKTQASISYDDECSILISLVTEIQKGDRRLHFPMGQLLVLKQWEVTNAKPNSRDHFFHTFNNLFIGFIILGNLLQNSRSASVPECYLNSSAGKGSIATVGIHHWESLWLLTCLFHDPGYIAQYYWATHSFSMGLQGQVDSIPQLPRQAIENINNAWETEYKSPRQDLSELFGNVSRIWEPERFKTKARPEFDRALRMAYFDGTKCGHSLMSGFALIMECQNSRQAMHAHHNRKLSVIASTIAALSMLFHDPDSRQTLKANGVPPISFEFLPYASVLMFADAIQDDRRDITVSQFTAQGVLRNLNVDISKQEVRAKVSLPSLPKRSWWAFKIAEYESVMSWINGPSQVKFIIDYRSSIGG